MMDILLEMVNLLSNRWGGILLRLTWQGAIFIGIIFFITLIFRKIPAYLKHILWFLLIAKFLIAPFFSPVGIPILYSPKPNINSQNILDIPSPVSNLDEGSLPLVNEDRSSGLGGISSNKPRMTLTRESYIFLFWLTGILFFLSNVLYRFLRLRHILKDSNEIKDNVLIEMTRECANSLKLKGLPRIVSTRHFTSPLSCGIIRPIILLPEGITEKLTEQELKLMLYHELGHIKRLDILTNWLQLIVQVIHFYNPLIWYVNRKIRLEREIACDDLVLHTTQGNNKAYADTLVKIVELTSRDDRCFSLGIVGVSEPFVNMKTRLIEIMKEGRRISTRISFQSAIFILLFGLLSMPLYSAVQNNAVVTQDEKSVGKEGISDAKDVIGKSATSPVLREGPGQPAPQELVSKILEANNFWLHPDVKHLSYTFSMKHTNADDLWKAAVKFTSPDYLVIKSSDGKNFEGKIADNYYENNPAELSTILQGVRFFGPLHALRRAPQDHALSVVGEERFDGKDVSILHLTPVGEAPKAAVERWEERLRDFAKRPRYVYEFIPVEKEINGLKQAVIEIKSRYEEGPSLSEIKSVHQANPAQIKWGGYIITAKISDYRGENRPVIVLDKDSKFQGESPFWGIITEDCINNMTLKLILGEGEEVFNEEIYNKEKTTRPKPERWLGIGIGCGVWRLSYGKGGHGVKIDQVWVDKATGMVIKEEGFSKDECRFIVEYGDFEILLNGRFVPCHIVVTLFGDEPYYPWIFDMKFKTYAGTAWLLERLEEFQDTKEPVAIAEVFDVTLKPDSVKESSTEEKVIVDRKDVKTSNDINKLVDDVRTKAEMMGRVEHFFMNNFRDVTARKSLEWGDVEADKDGNRSIRYKYNAIIWDKETMVMNQVFTFDRNGNFVNYKNAEGYPQKKEKNKIDTNTKEGMVELVEDFFQKNYIDIASRKTIEWGEVEKHENGSSSIRYEYEATFVNNTSMVMNQIFTFDPEGKFVKAENVKGFPKKN